MDRSWEQVKSRLSEEYLGKRGIHGIGYRASENAIVVYVEKGADFEGLRQELSSKAAPYDVIVVGEDAPRIW